MRVNVFLFFVFVTIGLCLWLMPTGSEAYPLLRKGTGRCPRICTSLYCPCGYLFDSNNCPLCRCRPSNTCTGRRPNAYGRPPFPTSHILY